MNKIIEQDITLSSISKESKLKMLDDLEKDINAARDIINGKCIYCKECKEYYLAQSFFSEEETIPAKICTYRDPINSGGNSYVDGYADIIYRVCPKGHKHIIDRKERRK